MIFYVGWIAATIEVEILFYWLCSKKIGAYRPDSDIYRQNVSAAQNILSTIFVILLRHCWCYHQQFLMLFYFLQLRFRHNFIICWYSEHSGFNALDIYYGCHKTHIDAVCIFDFIF